MAAQDDYTSLSELAERLGLDDTEADNFISSGMKRLGHKMKTMWEDNTDDGGNGGGGGDFFSSKRDQRGGNTRRIDRGSGGSGRRTGTGGAGWQYE